MSGPVTCGNCRFQRVTEQAGYCHHSPESVFYQGNIMVRTHPGAADGWPACHYWFPKPEPKEDSSE